MYNRADEIGQEIALTKALIEITKDEALSDTLFTHLDILHDELVKVVDTAIAEQKNVRDAIDDLLGPTTYNENDQTND